MVSQEGPGGWRLCPKLPRVERHGRQRKRKTFAIPLEIALAPRGFGHAEQRAYQWPVDALRPTDSDRVSPGGSQRETGLPQQSPILPLGVETHMTADLSL